MNKIKAGSPDKANFIKDIFNVIALFGYSPLGFLLFWYLVNPSDDTLILPLESWLLQLFILTSFVFLIPVIISLIAKRYLHKRIEFVLFTNRVLIIILVLFLVTTACVLYGQAQY